MQSKQLVKVSIFLLVGFTIFNLSKAFLAVSNRTITSLFIFFLSQCLQIKMSLKVNVILRSSFNVPVSEEIGKVAERKAVAKQKFTLCRLLLIDF